MKKLVVLGHGTGGTIIAAKMRQRLPESQWSITVIDKDIAGTITVEERAELAALDLQGNQHYDKIAPRPIEGARRLHRQLLNQRGNQ